MGQARNIKTASQREQPLQIMKEEGVVTLRGRQKVLGAHWVQWAVVRG